MFESKVTPGFPSAVASLDLRKEGASETAEMRARCPDPSKKCAARVSRDAGDGEERTGSCAGIGSRFSTGKAGRKKGRRHVE